MLRENVGDDEVLYRAVVNKPDFWKVEYNRPSSAAFKDSHGTSVDREGGRTPIQILENFDNRGMEDRGLVTVVANQCRTPECYAFLIPDPIPRSEQLAANPYHAVIYRDAECHVLTSKQARYLALNCNIVRTPELYRQ